MEASGLVVIVGIVWILLSFVPIVDKECGRILAGKKEFWGSLFRRSEYAGQTVDKIVGVLFFLPSLMVLALYDFVLIPVFQRIRTLSAVFTA